MSKKFKVETQIVSIQERLISIHQRLDSHKSKYGEVKSLADESKIEILNIKNQINEIKNKIVGVETIERLALEVENLLELVNSNIEKAEALEKMVTKSSFITSFIERLFWASLSIVIGGAAYLLK